MNRKPMIELKAQPEIDEYGYGLEFDSTKQSKLITEVRKYKLITPLFGGGVEGGVNDPVTLIRASGIRGHLRFWWRATRGGQFGGDLGAMKNAEAAIWGSASTNDEAGGPSVQIVVEVTNQGHPFVSIDREGKPVPIGNPKSMYSYATFPLKELGRNASIREGVEFVLTITHKSNQEKDVYAALWAWETFGGVGARTRRGFGALHQIDSSASYPTSAASTKEWIQNGLDIHVINGQWHKGVPHLAKTFISKRLKVVVLNREKDWPSYIPYRPKTIDPRKYPGNGNVDKNTVLDTWFNMLDCLRDFRQARTDRFGRSKWPEPDTICRITNQFLDNSGKSHSPVHSVHKFPRAAFGLPIVVKFKDDKDNEARFVKPDPDKTTIQLLLANRLSSPLIIRPLLCRSNDVVGIAFILDGTELAIGDQVVLVKNHRLVPGSPTRHDVSGTETLSLVFQNSRTKSETLTPDPLTKSLNILEAFLAYLEKEIR